MLAFFARFAVLGRGLWLLVWNAIRLLRNGWLWQTFMYYMFFYLGGVIGEVFKFLGIAFVATKFATPVLTDLVASRLLGLPPEWAQMMALSRVDDAITVILSAVVISSSRKVKLQPKTYLEA